MFAPLVSVVINCYNSEKYLKEAVESVINQTYDNWEIIFWDNQSTDSSSRIIKSFLTDKIHYYYAPEHTTLGKARNLAVEKANGEYINFLDCDDVWNADKLEQQVRKIEITKCEVVFTPLKVLVEDEKNINKTFLRTFRHLEKRSRIGSNIYKELLKDNFIAFSSVLFNKKLYENAGGINPQFQQNEDLDILLKCAMYTEIENSTNTLTYYRIHSNNNSVKNGALGYLENRYILSTLPPTSEIQKAIKRNETRIAYFMITQDFHFKKGIMHLLKMGSCRTLMSLVFRKIAKKCIY
jgi:glycosyltransferase involved in cell wall biosynthesis